MEINKHHRTALLEQLGKAIKDLEDEKRALNSLASREDFELSCHYEVAIFLATNKIHAIEKAIVNNELENF